MKTKIVMFFILMSGFSVFAQINNAGLLLAKADITTNMSCNNPSVFSANKAIIRKDFCLTKPLNPALKAGIAAIPYAVSVFTLADHSWESDLKYNLKTRTIVSAGLFIPTIATGYLLSNGEGPPNTALLAVHKLTAASNLVLLDATVLQKRKNASLSFLEAFTAITMNVCFVGTIATGGMLSMERSFPPAVNSFHSVTPWLTILSSGVLLYLLNQN